jgi:uncharacterized protein involved in outer membrane biogenesis
MRKFLIGLMAVAAALLAVPASAGATGGGTAKVYVVHGLPLPAEVTGPGTPVDVFVNGQLQLDNFTFGQQAGPLSLPQGSYKVEVKTPTAPQQFLFGRTVDVPASGNFSLVASFINDKGDLGINVFGNDVKRAKFGEGKIALHHAAAAPAVDIDGGIFPLSRIFPHLKKELAADVVNGQAATFALPTWLRYTVDVRLANTKTTVLPVDNVKVSRNVLTNVYVVGSAAGGTLQPLVTTIPVG